MDELVDSFLTMRQHAEREERWDKRFLGVADQVAGWSKDPSTKVGAVLVRDRRILSTGYNGPPSRLLDDERMLDRDFRLSRTVHAEKNCILHARQDLEGSTLYLSGFNTPCNGCCTLVIASGVAEIVGWRSQGAPKRWADEFKESLSMLQEAGVAVRLL